MYMGFLPLSERSFKVRLGKSTRAFRYRTYRLYFMGQGITLIGNWMQQLALGWLLLRLGGTATSLGLLVALTQVPTIFLGPVAGVVADRYEKRALLRIIQFLAAIHALTLAFLTLTGLIQLWMLFTLALFMGLVNAFEMTTRQSFVVEMVDDKRDLPNAIALNSLMFNSARAIGPAVGGQVVYFFGEGLCFLLNGIGYASSNFALRAMKLPVFKKVDTVQRNISKEFIDGFRYIRETPALIYSFFMLTTISIFGAQQMVILPILARDFLDGSSDTLGILMMAFGVGAIFAALAIAIRSQVVGSEKVIFKGLLITGVSQILLTLYPSMGWAFLLNALAGYGAISSIVSTNTVIQLLAAPTMRGRVVSFYSICLMGLGPCGGFIIGRLIDWQGIVLVLPVLGGVCIIAALVYRYYAARVVHRSLSGLTTLSR